ncbi:MAG TPA: hypothetical protein VHF58_03950, partial [Solirubrobacterales bacterium]|nr:hypothetical protein [Solirubrobacterales bacterium]
VKTVLQNKRVLYVSGSQAQPTTEPPAEGEGGAPAPVTAPTNVVIVIAGTDQDAEVLRFAQRTASEIGDQVSSALSVTLRRSGDATVEETTGITIEQLLNDYGLQIPDLTDIEELQPANEAEPEPEPAG